MALQHANRYRFNVAQFEKLIAAAILRRDRVELVDGGILDVRASAARDSGCVARVQQRLGDALGGDLFVACQQPLRLQGNTQVLPDFMVVSRGEEPWEGAPVTPEKVLLVVEVADASGAMDLYLKSHVYASATIPEYWVVDPVRSRVTTFSAAGSGGYGVQCDYAGGETVEPLVLRGPKVQVNDLLFDRE